MSNVPAYPKNPLLTDLNQDPEPPFKAGPESVEEFQPRPATPSVAPRSRNSFLKIIVEQRPVTAVVLTAGVGLVAGLLMRR